MAKAGEPVRKIYQRRLPSDETKDYYFIHRNSNPLEAIIVEYAFLDNKNDAERVKNNYKKYAESVVKAVANYKNIPYTEPRVQEEYVVQRGDTLWNISKKLGTTVDELKKTNNLNNNLLYVGQVLKVPNYETVIDNNTTYVVKKGDTLYSISKMYDIPLNELKLYNNINSDNLSVGQQIKIPESKSIITPSEDEVINEGSVYVVQKGDTLYSISKKFNVTIDDIKKNNSLISDILSIGMNLLIPTSGSLGDIIVHKVISGDSLWSLANKYNTTIDDIKKLNNLVSDLLIVGQELQVKRNTR
ncbi:MAG: LysM peptidoglycan-binding domain-containing protein [Bacilli bacterium]|nr:LysM peptidoglycan-binding domain-containing protein [Bacilli bacterium]